MHATSMPPVAGGFGPLRLSAPGNPWKPRGLGGVGWEEAAGEEGDEGADGLAFDRDVVRGDAAGGCEGSVGGDGVGWGAGEGWVGGGVDGVEAEAGAVAAPFVVVGDAPVVVADHVDA